MTLGRNSDANCSCTSRVSNALQTLGRWVLAFMMIGSASSWSAAASTKRWQLPVPVSMTGTCEPVTTALISPAPPRGISTSISPRACIISVVVSCPPSTSATASGFTPAADSPALSAVTIARFESTALELPRSRLALPDFRQMPAASAVTLGRAS